MRYQPFSGRNEVIALMSDECNTGWYTAHKHLNIGCWSNMLTAETGVCGICWNTNVNWNMIRWWSHARGILTVSFNILVVSLSWDSKLLFRLLDSYGISDLMFGIASWEFADWQSRKRNLIYKRDDSDVGRNLVYRVTTMVLCSLAFLKKERVFDASI